MKVKHVKIKIKDLANRYKNDEETGQVIGYGDKLNIRPPYQREFVYNDDQRNEVIYTVMKNFPLNIMYWAKTEDDSFEVLDGQQRTLSICQYVNGDFSILKDGLPFCFHSLTEYEKRCILNYELDVYQCEGNDKEKLDWFKVVNISGEKLTDQELRNVVYTGQWLVESKRKFSARNCEAYKLVKDYIKVSPIRQEYLETILKWISDRNECEIEDYMSAHQHDENCDELWEYFNSVIEWVKLTFPLYRKEMKSVNWGSLFNKFYQNSYDSNELENKVESLMLDDDVTNKIGIYDYVLSGNERSLSLRKFTEGMKRQVYEKQKGKCPKCINEGLSNSFDINEMESDHLVPWCKGGKTTLNNCQLLCKKHNRLKGGI